MWVVLAEWCSLDKTLGSLCIGGKFIDLLAHTDNVVKNNSHERFLQIDTNKLVSVIKTFGMVVNTAKGRSFGCLKTMHTEPYS